MYLWYADKKSRKKWFNVTRICVNGEADRPVPLIPTTYKSERRMDDRQSESSTMVSEIDENSTVCEKSSENILFFCFSAALGGGSTVKKSCSDRTASGASNVIGNDVISARRLSSR